MLLLASQHFTMEAAASPQPSFVWAPGALCVGDDLPNSPHNLTVKAAMDACATNHLCLAFTYHSTEREPNGVLPVYFKSTSEANSDAEWSHYTVGTALLFKTASGKCISSSASPVLSRFNVANVTVRRDEFPQAYVCGQTSMQPKEAKFLIDFLGFKNGPCSEDGYDADMGQSKRVCLPAVFGKQHCLDFELFSSK